MSLKFPCLSIAGFDSSGGAGLQADLKTFSALGSYGMTVLTAIPVQNTCGVRSCYGIPLSCIAEQLDAIFEDIEPHGIKIGMLFSPEVAELVADFLGRKARHIPIVVDPVMVAKSGDPLLSAQAVFVLKTKILRLATVVTPNLPEARILADRPLDDGPELAQHILDLGPQAVLLKGGHRKGQTADDFLWTSTGQEVWFSSPKIPSPHTHGTGCTLSAAICSFLSQGKSLQEACQAAKTYVFHAISHAYPHSIGKGRGPVDHFHGLKETIESSITLSIPNSLDFSLE